MLMCQTFYNPYTGNSTEVSWTSRHGYYALHFSLCNAVETVKLSWRKGKDPDQRKLAFAALQKPAKSAGRQKVDLPLLPTFSNPVTVSAKNYETL